MSEAGDTRASYRPEGHVTFDNLIARRRDGEAFIASSGEHVVMDLSGLEDGNSAAVALLMAWYRKAELEGKELEFRRAPAELIKIIDLSGMTSVLPVRPSAEDAAAGEGAR